MAQETLSGAEGRARKGLPERARHLPHTTSPEGSQWLSLSVWNESSVSWNCNVAGQPCDGFSPYLSIPDQTQHLAGDSCYLPVSHLKSNKALLFQKQQLHWSKQGRAQLYPPRALPLCSLGPAKFAFLIWRGQPGLTNYPEPRLGPAQPSPGAPTQVSGTGLAVMGSSQSLSAPPQSYLASVSTVG